MSTKNIIKVVAAFGLLALMLAFLGVNFVPSIGASSLTKINAADSAKQVRLDYRNESFRRAILPSLTLDTSDFFLRQRISGVKSSVYTGSDWIERHPTMVILTLRDPGSDFFQRHPLTVVKPSRYAGSDYIDRHPSSYYSNSDWTERHPEQINP